jgi:hypothetical protein
MRYLLIILLFASCSPTWHVKKAVKKGWTPEKETVTNRTIRLIKVHDTITNEVIRIDTLHEVETRTIYQDRPLLRYETKLIRDTIRIKEKADTKQIEARLRTEYKKAIDTIKAQQKRCRWWLYMLIGGVLVYFRRYLWRVVKFLISQIPI